MQKLLPFFKKSPLFSISADVRRVENIFTVSYEVNDQKNALSLPAEFRATSSELVRADNLWEDTCFELFLRPSNQKIYYEFNFSLNSKWNAYQFDEYRSPQPPKRTNHFLAQSMGWDGKKLVVELSGQVQLEDSEISLTAIIKEHSGIKHYFALAHLGDKPDFHLAESFILKR